VPLNLAFAVLLGAGTGLLGGFWREYTDLKVRDRHQVADWGLPVLTMVPRMGKAAFPTGGRGRKRGLVRSGGDIGWKTEVAEEAFRTLAFEVESAGGRLFREGLRSVAVTSAAEGEGKTFCATSLATQAALMGRRTLLVDADLRARGVGRWFDIPASRAGLGDLIQGGVAMEEAVHRVELRDGVTLDVLASGRASATSSRLVTSSLRRLIEEAGAHYDLVVVDTPPLNILTDAAQVATAVDGVLLVVRAGMTERPALELALERLERMGGEALGAVLNGVELPDYYTSYAGFRK
jgi:capsular exopolysaccharide synthesis family protein